METPVLQMARTAIHWIALTIFVYIFGYAGLYKIIGVESMMAGMEDIGFGKTATVLIGLTETAGVAGVLAGFYYHPAKILSVLCLWPFAIGALTVHLSYHHPFSVYLNALLVCIMPLIILRTDEKFNVIFG